MYCVVVEELCTLENTKIALIGGLAKISLYLERRYVFVMRRSQ